MLSFRHKKETNKNIADTTFKLSLNNQAPSVDVSTWLDCGELTCCILALEEFPRSKLAEVNHASWKNCDRMGVSLLDRYFFDVRDSFLIESR